MRTKLNKTLLNALSRTTPTQKQRDSVKANYHKNKLGEFKSLNIYRNSVHCIICQEKRVIEFCHIIALKDGGSNDVWNIMALCPTHHSLYDRNMLNEEEYKKIIDRVDIANRYHNLNLKDESIG